MSISTRNGSSNKVIIYFGFSGRLEIIRRPISSRFARLSRSVKLVGVVWSIHSVWFLLPFNLFSLFSKLATYTLTRVHNWSLAPFWKSMLIFWSIQWISRGRIVISAKFQLKLSILSPVIINCKLSISAHYTWYGLTDARKA